jgi:hypothetical protein
MSANPRLDRALADAPRWMFLGILVFAPWAYGSTWHVAMTILNQFSAALIVLWLAVCAWRRQRPVLPWLPVALVALLLLQGWWFAWNAHWIHTYITWTTVNSIWDNPPLPDWPGAIDRRLAQFSMMNVTALLALFLFACDLMIRPVWRKRVWLTLALTVVSVAVGGVLLKLGWPEVREWLWGQEVAKLTTTFATYRYHGNAASLLSIGWALALGFTVAAAGRPDQPLRLAGWVLALLVLLIGLFMNSSRAGWALAVILALLVGARFGWPWWHTARVRFDWKRGLIQGTVLAAAVGGLLFIALSKDWKEKLVRLNTIVETIQERYPSKVYHQLVKETGLLGNGPDGFQMALPKYMEAFGMSDEKYGFWRHAHNDYYEYLANWGWWGFALWAVLLGGGLGLGLRDHFRAPVQWGSTQWALGFCGGAAMLGLLLHAFWDFPLEKASILLYFLTLLADGWAREENTKDPEVRVADSVPQD